MSASLVGSEMCIRDSPGPPASPRGGYRPPGPLQNAPPAQGAGGAFRGGPAVSYTHLTLPTICSV
eukprot:15291036-Alexandrium_andersonii.AAC.1